MELSVMEDLEQSATRYTPDEDLALVEASTSGDIAAFEELVQRYDRKLLRIAQQVTGNLEDAQDVVQETFLKAFQKLSQFQRNSKFSTWLIRIALNESFMKLRKRRSHARELPLEYDDPQGDHLPLDVADWSPNPEQLYSGSELQEILRQALEELAPILRVVFILRDVEDLSIKETAAALDLQPSAVKARLFRARLQLREKLSKYFRKEGLRLSAIPGRSSPDHRLVLGRILQSPSAPAVRSSGHTAVGRATFSFSGENREG
jgi:RNA polymerase sigma-70 factor (ECF subfamily)